MAETETFDGHLRDALAGGGADISPDGKLIAVLGGEVELRDAQTGDKVLPNASRGGLLAPKPEWVRFSPDGRLLVAAAGRTPGANTVRVWLVGEREPLYEIAPQSDDPPTWSRFAPLGFFSSDSKLLAVNKGSTVRLYEAETGTLVDSLRTNLQEVNQVAFSRAGDVMAVGSYFDDLIEVWDLSLGTLVDSVRFGHLSPVPGVKGYVAQLQFTPDDSKLLTGLIFRLESNATVRRVVEWDREDYSVLNTIEGGSFMAFSPDGQHVAFHRSGLQRAVAQEGLVFDNRPEYAVQIMAYPQWTPLISWRVPPAWRWVGWADDSAVWVVSVVPGYIRGGYLGNMVRWEIDFDLLLAADTLRQPSPVREISFE